MATTPVDRQVAEKMMQCLTLQGDFGNPDSNTHALGWRAKQLVEEARGKVASLIQAQESEILWTSGATEANNLALKGAALFNQHRGRHIITLNTEHKSVLDTCHFLEKDGFEVTYLTVESNGLVDIEKLKNAFRDETILLSVMYVNNEIGVIQDIEAIANETNKRGIILHVDAVQAAGKIPIDVKNIPIDLLSLSAHKVYGPKGIGALYLRRKPRVRIKAQMHGGSQQGGLRAGTLPTHQIVGMGEAFSLAKLRMYEDNQQIKALSEYFWAELSTIAATKLNGDMQQRIPHNLNVCFQCVDAESLMLELSDLAVSNGSACNSITTQASYVLTALGLTQTDAFSSIRFSFGRYTTQDEIDYALGLIKKAVTRLRSMSPLWEDATIR